MKIEQLDIEGFRSLKNVSWKPGNLNVIIGPNGSGKSNLLRMLELIRASASRQLEDHIQAEGGMGQIVWDNQVHDIKWQLAIIAPALPPTYRLTYEVDLMREVLTNSFQVRDERLDRYDLLEEDSHTVERILVRHNRKGRLYDETGQAHDLPEGTMPAQETLLSLAAELSARNRWIDILQRPLANWAIYHDSRADREALVREPAVVKQETQVASDGQNLINVLHTLYTGDREFKRHVNSAMSAAFGNDFDELTFTPATGKRIQLLVRWKTLKREQSAADLSDGTLRFLFLLAVLASPNPAPLIAIDEPEAGLHPSMLPIIAELAVDAAERTQVVFTTHSDQFLDAFRETNVRPTTTVARWENGETTLTTLADEDLAYWLKDYSLGSMFRSGELESLA